MPTEFTLTGPPKREDPKGPLMQCRNQRCLMILRRDECRLGNDGELVCPWCERMMSRYRAEWESLNK